MNIAKIIEIVEIPHGTAPGWVRAAWVGCILPTATLTCGHVPSYAEPVAQPKRSGLMPAKEYLTLPGVDEKIDGFDVDQGVALRVLEVHSPEAAEWFYRHGYPQTGDEWTNFGFKLKEVKIIRAYTQEELRSLGPLHDYGDMETGTMRRMG